MRSRRLAVVELGSRETRHFEKLGLPFTVSAYGVNSIQVVPCGGPLDSGYGAGMTFWGTLGVQVLDLRLQEAL